MSSDPKDYKERSRGNENAMECGQWVLIKRRNKRILRKELKQWD